MGCVAIKVKSAISDYNSMKSVTFSLLNLLNMVGQGFIKRTGESEAGGDGY